MSILAVFESIQNEIEEQASEDLIHDTDDLNSDSLEIGQLTQSLDEEGSNIDAGTQAIGEVQEHLDPIEAIVEDTVSEGLTEDAAQQAIIAVESVLIRLGLPKAHITRIIARETAMSASKRERAVYVAESFKDTLNKVGAAIAAAAKRVWEFIISIFNKIFQSIPRLEKALEKLTEEAKKLKDGDSSNATIQTPLADAVQINGKTNYDTYKQTVFNTFRLIEVTSETFTARENYFKQLDSVTTKSVGLTFDPFQTVQKSFDEFMKTLNKGFNNSRIPIFKEETKNGTTTRYIGPFLNGRIVELTVVGSDATRFKFRRSPDAKMIGEIKCFSVNEILHSLAGCTGAFRVLKEVTAKKHGFIKNLRDMREVANLDRKIKNQAFTVIGCSHDLYGAFPSFVYQALTTTLRLIRQMVKQYKSGSAEAKSDAPLEGEYEPGPNQWGTQKLLAAR